MAEDVNNNTHSINLTNTTTMDNHPDLPSVCTEQSNQKIPVLKSTSTSQTTTRNKYIAYKSKSRPKYELDEHRLMLQQVQAMDEEYNSILLEPWQGISNCNQLLNRLFEIDQ